MMITCCNFNCNPPLRTGHICDNNLGHHWLGYWDKGFDCSMMTSWNGNIFRVTGPLCGEFTGPGKFPTQRPVTRTFDVFFDLRLNKRLSKQPWEWWFETPSWSLWRQCNGHHLLERFSVKCETKHGHLHTRNYFQNVHYKMVHMMRWLQWVNK